MDPSLEVVIVAFECKLDVIQLMEVVLSLLVPMQKVVSNLRIPHFVVCMAEGHVHEHSSVYKCLC